MHKNLYFNLIYGGEELILYLWLELVREFIDAGFTQPKPLLDVAGKPMIMRAAESLPQADEWIFICRDFHIKRELY